ncbi:unnamed protein product [Amoebophrya sp. A120]|nr:unnamed protein product [Amoebophrya sp. A120]|eukprot:GSA120T00010453001.1
MEMTNHAWQVGAYKSPLRPSCVVLAPGVKQFLTFNPGPGRSVQDELLEEAEEKYQTVKPANDQTAIKINGAGNEIDKADGSMFLVTDFLCDLYQSSVVVNCCTSAPARQKCRAAAVYLPRRLLCVFTGPTCLLLYAADSSSLENEPREGRNYVFDFKKKSSFGVYLIDPEVWMNRASPANKDKVWMEFIQTQRHILRCRRVFRWDDQSGDIPILAGEVNNFGTRAQKALLSPGGFLIIPFVGRLGENVVFENCWCIGNESDFLNVYSGGSDVTGYKELKDREALIRGRLTDQEQFSQWKEHRLRQELNKIPRQLQCQLPYSTRYVSERSPDARSEALRLLFDRIRLAARLPSLSGREPPKEEQWKSRPTAPCDFYSSPPIIPDKDDVRTPSTAISESVRPSSPNTQENREQAASFACFDDPTFTSSSWLLFNRFIKLAPIQSGRSIH